MGNLESYDISKLGTEEMTDSLFRSGESRHNLPEGTYVVNITDTIVGRNKKNTGDALWIIFEVLEGAYAGYTLRQNYNLAHDTSQYSVDRSMAELHSLFLAIRFEGAEIDDSTLLHENMLRVKWERQGERMKVTEYSPETL